MFHGFLIFINFLLNWIIQIKEYSTGSNQNYYFFSSNKFQISLDLIGCAVSNFQNKRGCKMIESTNRAWKACLLALSFLFAPIVSNAELPIGSTPKTIVLQGEQGKLVDGGGPWKSDRFKGFVTILFYVDPDESDLNNAASEALKDANLPADQVRSVAVINMDATLLPNFLIQGKLEDKQKEYQNTLYVMDYKKVLVNEWGLGDHNNDVVIFDKQGKVLFSVDGQLNDSQIKQMLAAVKSGFN